MRKCIQHRIHNNTEIPSILLDLPKEALSILMILVLEKLKQDWESQVWVQSETLQEEAKSCGVAERCSLPSMLQVQDAQDPGFHLDTVKTNLKCLSTASQSSQGSLFHHMLRVQGLLFFHFQGWVFLCQSPSYTVQCLRGETMMHFNKGAIANWEGAEHIWSKRTFLEHWNVTGFALLGLGLALGSCHPLLGLPFVVVLPTLWLTIVGFWKHVGLQLERNFASGWIRLSLTFPWFRWLVRWGYQIQWNKLRRGTIRIEKNFHLHFYIGTWISWGQCWNIMESIHVSSQNSYWCFKSQHGFIRNKEVIKSKSDHIRGPNFAWTSILDNAVFFLSAFPVCPHLDYTHTHESYVRYTTRQSTRKLEPSSNRPCWAYT